MQHITKLCADNLRTLSDKHGIKLKASHAHDLVAAFFGYQSRAALLADTYHPLSHLRPPNVIILSPTAPIDQRRNNLLGLPPNLPDTYTLGEWVYASLLPEKWIVSNPWPAYEMLATFLADEYLRENQMEKSYRSPVGQGLKVERVDDCLFLTVLRFYQKILLDGSVHEENFTTTIRLKRIAGHIGYAKPEISAQIELLK